MLNMTREYESAFKPKSINNESQGKKRQNVKLFVDEHNPAHHQ